MHDDRELVEKRIHRELAERVLPLVHLDERPLEASAGPDLERLSPLAAGSPWGPPWQTTWFRFDGVVPDAWSGRRVEALIDLGFTRAPAGFQCEGLVLAAVGDGRWAPRHGLHPNRRYSSVPSRPGPVDLVVEAASNPSFPQFRPSRLGSPDTAGEAPLYRYRGAQLVLVDPETEALVHDLDVLDGIMHSLPLADPRRSRLRVVLATALDLVPDIGAARRALRPELDGRAEPRHRITAIGHAHIDTAWLWPLREARRKCLRTFASVVELMEHDPAFRFACSQAQHFAWIEQDHPELFEKIRGFVESGQWIPVGGMWVEADMNLPSGESLVRQIVHGQRYVEQRFGKRCTEVWIPDVFGYPAGLPQVFAAGGMTRFVTQKLSWNKQNRFPHHTFHWEGLDGTRVLTHFPPVDTYNAEVTPAEVAGSMGRFAEHAWSGHSLLPFGYGDGGGGPTREMIERARRLATADHRAMVELGTPAAFFDAVEREAFRGADVPVWRGELYFETHRGTLTSQLRTKLGNRRCERLLVEAELWAATAGRQIDLDGAWKEVLTQQFHDILPGSSIAWVHREAEATFERVATTLESLVTDTLASIVPAGEQWLANPADVPVDDVVVLDVDGADLAPSQRLSDGRVAVVATVPALGTAPVVAGEPDGAVVVTDDSMADGRLAIRWEPSGHLSSVIDVVRGREVVPRGQTAAALELARDQPVEYDAWDLEAWTRSGGQPLGGRARIEVLDRGPLVGRVRVDRVVGPSSVTLIYELRAGSGELLVHLDVDWQHDEHLLSIAFPIDVRADTAACDVQFGVVHRPTHPSSPWDAAKFEVCAHRFVDLSEPSFGVAVLNDGRYGHSVFDGAIRVSLARAARYPDPDADRGRHRVTLALRPHGPGIAEVRSAAGRLNRPLRLVAGAGAPGDQVVTPLVSVLGAGGQPAPGVEVDAVKPADDDSGDVVVRLHEACGDRVAVTVGARTRIGRAWRCDLLEEPLTPEEVGDGIVALVLRPFELVTLRLHIDPDFDGRTLHH